MYSTNLWQSQLEHPVSVKKVWRKIKKKKDNHLMKQNLREPMWECRTTKPTSTPWNCRINRSMGLERVDYEQTLMRWIIVGDKLENILLVTKSCKKCWIWKAGCGSHTTAWGWMGSGSELLDGEKNENYGDLFQWLDEPCFKWSKNSSEPTHEVWSEDSDPRWITAASVSGPLRSAPCRPSYRLTPEHNNARLIAWWLTYF